MNHIVENIGERAGVHKTLAPRVKLNTIGGADPGFNLGRQGVKAATKLTKKHLGFTFGFTVQRSLTERFGLPFGLQLFKKERHASVLLVWHDLPERVPEKVRFDLVGLA